MNTAFAAGKDACSIRSIRNDKGFSFDDCSNVRCPYCEQQSEFERVWFIDKVELYLRDRAMSVRGCRPGGPV
jgi:hypothetical protein